MAKRVNFKRVDERIRGLIDKHRVSDRFIEDVYQDAWVAFLEGKNIEEAVIRSNKMEKFHYVTRI